MREPAPQVAERVFQSWQNEWENVPDDEAAVKRVTDEIMAARKTVLEVLAKLE